MNALTHSTFGDETPTMSSREIAELVSARHDNVRRTIERLAEKGVIELPPLEEIATGARAALEYVFSGEAGKRDTYIVVAQLCPEFTARIVDRWQELERRQRDPVVALSDPAALRGLLLTYSEKVLALEAIKASLAPKADAFERIAEADGSLCVTDAAKALQVRPKDLFNKLQADHWIYRRTGGKGWLGYQSKVQSGLVEHKVETIQRPDGSEAIREQVRITSKGLTKLAEQFAA